MDITGKVLGSYKILEAVGSGGFATVYLARDVRTNEMVAVKVLLEQYSHDPQFVARFRREAQVLKSLPPHRNIVGLRDYGQADGLHYLVMDYLEGKDLVDILEERGKLTVEEAAQVTVQVATALQVAAGAGLVHRDIKPQNIKLLPDGSVKVMDFGIARAAEASRLTQSGVLVGTAAYIAPEIWEGRPADEASDLYSLGCVFYQMLAGQAPFEGETTAAVMRAHMQAAPDLKMLAAGGVPADVCLLVGRLLAKKPGERPKAADLAQQLAPYLRKAAVPGAAAESLASDQTAVRPWAATGGSGSTVRATGPAAARKPAAPSSARKQWVTCLVAGATLSLILLGTAIGAIVLIMNATKPAATPTPVPTTRIVSAGTKVTTVTPTIKALPTSVPSRTPSPVTPSATATRPVTLTPTPAPTRTSPFTPIAGPTATPSPLSGLEVRSQPSAQSGLRVEMRYADGAAKPGSWVGIRAQKADISGNPVYGDRLKEGRTDNTGAVFFALEPGTYALELGDLTGGSWGGPYNYVVSGGQTTVVSLTLARLTIGLRNADGKALGGKYTVVGLQKLDLSGNPLWGDRVAEKRTDNTGVAVYDLVPGLYAIGIGDIAGEAWGEELNHALPPGQNTSLVITLGRLTVGVKDAGNRPVSRRWVGIYLQKKDVGGNTILGDRFLEGRSDDTGVVSWDVTAGTYAVQIGDISGYLWGDELNHTVRSGQTTQIIVSLGRLTVGLKGNDSKPLAGKWVWVYMQKKDVGGNMIKGDRILEGRTGDTGMVSWDVTAGRYVVEIADVGMLADVPVQAGAVTFTDGRSITNQAP